MLSISLMSCSDFERVVLLYSIQPFDRWGFKQNLDGDDEEAFYSVAQKMDRRSEQLKVKEELHIFGFENVGLFWCEPRERQFTCLNSWSHLNYFIFSIDRMHKWRPKKYSFVFVLIRPTSLVLKEHFFCILSMLTRLVRLISIKRK